MRPAPNCSAAAARQAVSLLLGYPDGQLLGHLPTVVDAVTALPPHARDPLRRFLDHFEATPLGALQQEYVATFDLRQRCCLYLSWWTHGDTRERGKALVRFKDAYRAAGLTPPEHELSDHLAVVLEFAATGDVQVGTAMLIEHRPAIEQLHAALSKHRSPYALLIDAVLATTGGPR